MRVYLKLVEEFCPDVKPNLVLAYMYLEYNALDHLSRDQFKRCAMECAEAVRYDVQGAEDLAVSMGFAHE